MKIILLPVSFGASNTFISGLSLNVSSLKDIIKYFHDEVTVGDNILETHVVGVDSGDVADDDTPVDDRDESLADVVQSSINNQ